MPEKQLCGKCKRPLKGTWETVCKCSNPEPQIPCKWCGKPKGEHQFDDGIAFCEPFGIDVFEPAPKSSSEAHTVKESTFEYTFDDCIFYKILCSCGKECTGWTKQDVIEEYQKHLKKSKSAPQKIKR